MVDRSKLKATEMSTLKKQESAVNKATNKGSNRAGFVTVDKGWNKFRIYPKHPDAESFIFPAVRHYIPFIGKDDDGKEKLMKKFIFNSKVHGNTEKDVIDEYLNFARKIWADQINDQNELTKKLAPLFGQNGITGKAEWVCYVDKYDPKGKKVDFGRLKLTAGAKNKMEKLTITEEADQPIVIDPFTDPDEGIAIILHYTPDALDKSGKKDLKNFYNLSLEQKQVTKFNIELIPTPLTDEEIEAFLLQEPLHKMYVNSYTRKDFETAVAGLRLIDDENKYGVFNHPEFLEVLEEIDKYYPEIDEVKDEVEDEKPKVVNSGDDLDPLNREELKALIRREFGEGVIIIRKSFSDDSIRDLIRDKRAELKLQSPVVDEVEDEVEDLPAEEMTPVVTQSVQTPPSSVGSGNAAERLKRLQEKLKK